MVMNISCKFEKASYNIFFVRAVTVKSLYILRRRQRNEVKSIVSTGCYPVDTISKLNFYKLIPYPMDNCFTGRRDRSRQTTEKVILYIILEGPVTDCAFARCHLMHTSCLDRMTSSRLFRCLDLLDPE